MDLQCKSIQWFHHHRNIALNLIIIRQIFYVQLTLTILQQGPMFCKSSVVKFYFLNLAGFTKYIHQL